MITIIGIVSKWHQSRKWKIMWNSFIEIKDDRVGELMKWSQLFQKKKKSEAGIAKLFLGVSMSSVASLSLFSLSCPSDSDKDKAICQSIGKNENTQKKEVCCLKITNVCTVELQESYGNAGVTKYYYAGNSFKNQNFGQSQWASNYKQSLLAISIWQITPKVNLETKRVSQCRSGITIQGDFSSFMTIVRSIEIIPIICDGCRIGIQNYMKKVLYAKKL